MNIPNLADAEDASQSQIDSRDISDILAAAAAYTGVLSGCVVTAQGTPDMTVAVAAGTVVVAGAAVAVTAGNVTITANASGNPRFDLICVDGSGVKSAVAGTPAVNPVFPNPAGKVVLAAVRVPTGIASISTAKIVDKRVLNTLTQLNFGTAGDTNLSSAAAGQLYTTGLIRAEGLIVANNVAGSGKMVLGYSPAANAGIEFGTDTWLYRSAAGILKTDGAFYVVGAVHVNEGTTNVIQLHTDGGIYWGVSADTVLYRAGAGNLATTLGFTAGTYVQARQLINADDTGSRWYGILFGAAQDCSIYKRAAGVLGTDVPFVFEAQIRVTNIVAAAVGGAQGKKLPIYDAAGTLQGYIPIYAT